jgi:hypothetical protein
MWTMRLAPIASHPGATTFVSDLIVRYQEFKFRDVRIEGIGQLTCPQSQ